MRPLTVLATHCYYVIVMLLHCYYGEMAVRDSCMWNTKENQVWETFQEDKKQFHNGRLKFSLNWHSTPFNYIFRICAEMWNCLLCLIRPFFYLLGFLTLLLSVVPETVLRGKHDSGLPNWTFFKNILQSLGNLNADNMMEFETQYLGIYWYSILFVIHIERRLLLSIIFSLVNLLVLLNH